MRSVPPHQRAEKAVQDLLRQGMAADVSADAGDGGSVTSLLMRLGLQALLDRALEEERTDFVGRERYERTGSPAEEPPAQGYRNGYKPGHVDTAEGRVEVAIPQVRQSAEPFQPQTLAAVRGRSTELERLVVELYARGLSTRDIEQTFRDQATGSCTLSRTAVSQITEALWQEYEAFQQRDLSGFAVLYVFLDAVFEPLRRQGRTREGVLCAWGIDEDGHKVLLHLGMGSTESYESWHDWLRGTWSPAACPRRSPSPLTGHPASCGRWRRSGP
jgi:putative transposase